MSDPFAPSFAEPSPTTDPHVIVALILLLSVGIPLFLLGVLMVPTGLMLGLTDPEFTEMGQAGPWAGLAIGVIEFLLLGGFGSLYLAGAWGLITRKRWGWVLSLVAFGLWLGGCCMPVGLYGFYALLREPIRKAYGF